MKTMSTDKLMYNKVIFERWYRESQDKYPWAVICHQCSDTLLDGAGWGGEPTKKVECCVKGCTNTAETFITLVDSKPL